MYHSHLSLHLRLDLGEPVFPLFLLSLEILGESVVVETPPFSC